MEEGRFSEALRCHIFWTVRMLAFQHPVFCMPVFFVVQKNSEQVFWLALRAKKLLVSFFLALLILLAKKISVESRPLAESWLVATANPEVVFYW